MIPKIIHYCWFGRGEKSKLMKKCIKSWKKYCPDYEIIEWNEDNFDVNSCLWTKQAYECKKWAFISDYVRLKVLYENGGIYMDTDVELRKPLDSLLNNDAFSGFERPDSVPCGIIAAIKKQPIIEQFMSFYEELPFILEDGSLNALTNPRIFTNILLENGLLLNNEYQIVNGMAIYPRSYFYPIHYYTVQKNFTKHTHAIHHYEGTWLSPQRKKELKKSKWHSTKLYRFLIWLRYLPNKFVRKIFGNERVDNWKNKRGKQ